MKAAKLHAWLAALLLASSANGASPPTAQPADAGAPDSARAVDSSTSAREAPWAVVALSPESKNEAEAALPALTAAAGRWVRLAPGFPRIIDSGTVRGFKSGYHVVLLGYCETKEQAAQATAWVKLEAPLAYFKQVAQGPSTCPTLSGKPTQLERPEELLLAVPRPGESDTRAVVVSGDARTAMECRTRSTVVQLRRGPELLDEVYFEGECLGACTAKAKAEGKAMVKEIEAAIRRGDATESQLDYNFTGCFANEASAPERFEALGPIFTILVAKPGPHDVSVFDIHLFGPGCGGRLGHSLLAQEVFGNVTPRLPKQPGATWRRFAVGLDGPVATPALRLSWDDATCGWRVEPIPEKAP